MHPLLDDAALAERYFFPRWMPLPDPFIVPVAGAELHCWRSPPRPGAPVLLHFHGNGEVVGEYVARIAPAWIRAGFDLVLAEYRGYGGSTGTPALASMLDDVPKIVDALAVPPEDLFVYGRSVGSLYAIEAAHRFGAIRGLVLESGIADLLERLRLRLTADELGATEAELEAAVRARFDHGAKLRGYSGPLLVLHASDDDLVDVSHAERNHASAGGADKQLVTFARGGHNGLLAYNWPRYVETLGAFFSAR
ncbi:MAG: alpha/beta hydrolase [Myxococcales bacterium]|nr:alpha/beta hydrolase [Myxococcales bacterium]